MVIVFFFFICSLPLEALSRIHLFHSMTESQQQPIWEDKESIRGQTWNSNSEGAGRKKLLPRCETILLVSSSGETVLWRDKKGQNFFLDKKINKKENKTCSLLFLLYAACYPSKADNTSTLLLVKPFWPLAVFFLLFCWVFRHNHIPLRQLNSQLFTN